MLKFELTRFEAQDVITASGVAVPAHEHHWTLNDSPMVGVAGNKVKVQCAEDGCDSTLIVNQPAGFSYKW